MASETLGKYRLLGPLAAGGMGEVFLAEQEGPHGFRRRVVVKRLLRHLASDPGFVEMFLNEARVAALITHPNVAQIVELGEADGAYFIAMEYVRGRSLRRLLGKLRARGEKVPPPIAVAIVAGVLHGLHAAHTLVDDEGNPRGCVHRDVSAENVLLSVDAAVKLVDFGIAKALSASTARGTSLRGKYGYLAPEQYRNEPLDPRTDSLRVRRPPLRAPDRQAAVRRRERGRDHEPRTDRAAAFVDGRDGVLAAARSRGGARAVQGPRRALPERGGDGSGARGAARFGRARRARRDAAGVRARVD